MIQLYNTISLNIQRSFCKSVHWPMIQKHYNNVNSYPRYSSQITSTELLFTLIPATLKLSSYTTPPLTNSQPVVEFYRSSWTLLKIRLMLKMRPSSHLTSESLLWSRLVESWQPAVLQTAKTLSSWMQIIPHELSDLLAFQCNRWRIKNIFKW